MEGMTASPTRLKVLIHTLVGNTSSLLWWPSDQDLVNTPEIQTSRQFLLTAQLVNFITPNQPSLVGGTTIAQVLDLNFEENNEVKKRSVEMEFSVPLAEVLPTMSILFVLVNKRPCGDASEIVAVHLFHLFEGSQDVRVPRLGPFEVLLFNMAHQTNGIKANNGVLSSSGNDLQFHALSQTLPDSLWQVLSNYPEEFYSTLRRSSVECVPSLERVGYLSPRVWLSLTVPRVVVGQNQCEYSSPFSRIGEVELPSLDLEEYSKEPASDTSSLVDFNYNVLADEAIESLKMKSGDIDMAAAVQMVGQWDPTWKSPAEEKHDRVVERSEDSWFLTPSKADMNRLNVIEAQFLQWEPLKDTDKALVWKYRGHLKGKGASLYLFASCVKWNSQIRAREAMRLIYGKVLTDAMVQEAEQRQLQESRSHGSLAAYDASQSGVAPSPQPFRPSPQQQSLGASKSLSASVARTHPQTDTRKLLSGVNSSVKLSAPIKRGTKSTTGQESPYHRTLRQASSTSSNQTTTAVQTPPRASSFAVQAPSAHHQRHPSLPTERSTTPPLPSSASSSSDASPSLPSYNPPSRSGSETDVSTSSHTNAAHSSSSTPHMRHRSLSTTKTTRLIIEDEPWQVKEPIEVLPMLTWRHAPELREFLVKHVLKSKDIEPVVLPLVHMLRFEDVPTDPQVKKLLTISHHDYNGISFEPVPLYESTDQLPVSPAVAAVPELSKPSTPLFDFLCDRANQKPLGYHIYWNMAADPDLEIHFQTLQHRLSGSPMMSYLEKQTKLHEAIQKIGRDCKDLPDEARMKAIIDIDKKTDLAKDRIDLPLAPHLKFIAFVPTDSHVFKSNNKPIKLTLEVLRKLPRPLTSPSAAPLSASRQDLGRSTTSPNTPTHSPLMAQVGANEPSTSAPSPSSSAFDLSASAIHRARIGSGLSTSSMDTKAELYDIIYKYGDNLRQDQTMMVLLQMVDKMLKSDRRDFRLMVYEVLPFSPVDGIMKCVTGTKSVEDILKSGGRMSTYLRKLSKAPYEEILETYIRSCAGYCVLNLVFGWGDRHLANLLVGEDGRIFHIDFGFAYGEEPNYGIFQLVIRLDSAMLEPMHTDALKDKFITYACDAYLALRKYGHQILSVIYVMRDDANFVRDRLQLGLSEDEAARLLIDILRSAQTSRKQAWLDYWRSWKS